MIFENYCALDREEPAVLVLLGQGQYKNACIELEKAHRFLPFVFSNLHLKGGTHEPCQKVYRIFTPFERHLCDRLRVQRQRQNVAPLGATLQNWLPMPPL